MNKKIIMVVGGLGLIGKQIVDDLIKTGHKVMISDLKIDDDNEWFFSLQKKMVSFHKINIEKKNSIDKAIRACEKQFGSLDVCINLAYPKSKNWGVSFEDITMDEISNHLRLQLGTSILLSQRLLNYFEIKGKGNIVLCSSIQGISAPKFEHYLNTQMTSPVEYTAAKTSIIGITKWLAKYCKGKNIRVNCISPGGVLYNQEKSFLTKYKSDCLSKGMLDPKDLSGVIKFLVSDDSEYINGQNIIIDDGWSL